MKFLTITLYSLLTVSSVLGGYAPKGEKPENYEQIQEEYKKYQPDIVKCDEIKISYETECFPEVKTSDEACKILNNQKCKDYFENGINKHESCNKLPTVYQDNYNETKDFEHLVLKAICEKKEDGSTCPMVEALLSNKNELELLKEKDNLLKETCKSKKCTDNTIAVIDHYVKTYEDQTIYYPDQGYPEEYIKSTELAVQEMKSISEELKKNECLKQQGDTSDANSTTITLRTLVFISLGLLFYLY